MKQYFLPLTLGLLVAPLYGMEAEFNGKQEQEKQSSEEAAKQAAKHAIGGLSRFSKPEGQRAFLAMFFKELADGASEYLNVGSAAQLDADLNGMMFTQASARYFLNSLRLPNDLLWHILSYLEPAERLHCLKYMRIALIRQASDTPEVRAVQDTRSEKLMNWYRDTDKRLKATEELRDIFPRGEWVVMW